MSLENPECPIDRFAQMLGYQDIEHAIETEKMKMRQRLLQIAKRDEGIVLYHQTTQQRALRIRRERFKLCQANDPPDALCFAFNREQTDDVASHHGAIVTVRLPLSWLLAARWDFDLSSDGLHVHEDIPPQFIRNVDAAAGHAPV